MGSVKRVPINVRILAATNRDLERAVAEGTFRRDLFFRLNVLTLRIPALRERRQDIPLLVAHFLERIGHDAGTEKTISDEALKALLNYDWPGNVRELENALERACALSSANEIQLRDLPTKIYGAPIELMGISQPKQWHRADGGTGETNDPERAHASERRQDAGGAAAGHRQDDAVPQAERVRVQRILIVIGIETGRSRN